MIYIVLWFNFWWATVCGSTKIEPKFVVHLRELIQTFEMITSLPADVEDAQFK